MYVAGVEGVEPLAQRAEKRTMTEEVDDMVLRAESNLDAIAYGYLFDAG
jgi:predicted neutral ceramidase superfamily lipid hydrolase